MDDGNLRAVGGWCRREVIRTFRKCIDFARLLGLAVQHPDRAVVAFKEELPTITRPGRVGEVCGRIRHQRRDFAGFFIDSEDSLDTVS